MSIIIFHRIQTFLWEPLLYNIVKNLRDHRINSSIYYRYLSLLCLISCYQRIKIIVSAHTQRNIGHYKFIDNVHVAPHLIISIPSATVAGQNRSVRAQPCAAGETTQGGIPCQSRRNLPLARTSRHPRPINTRVQQITSK